MGHNINIGGLIFIILRSVAWVCSFNREDAVSLLKQTEQELNLGVCRNFPRYVPFSSEDPFISRDLQFVLNTPCVH